MNDSMLRIDVGGDDHEDEACLLRERLLHIGDLRVGAVSPFSEPGVVADGSRMIIHLSSLAAALGLVGEFSGWLNSRSDAVTVEVTFADSKTAALKGGTTVKEVIRRMEPVVVSVLDADQRARLPTGILRHLLDQNFGSLEAEWTGSKHGSIGFATGVEAGEIAGQTLPVTIYLSKEEIHERVEAAVGELLAAGGLRVVDRDEPVIGSWFRRMRAVMRSPAAREGALVAAHAADTRLVLAQDAAVTATLLQNLGPVIASLQPTKDAVLRVGALLIVKVDWVVSVFQLTAAQQAILDHQPRLAHSPHEIIAALNLTAAAQDGDSPASLHRGPA